MKIQISKYPLYFKQAVGTSRGILKKKNTWFIKLSHSNSPENFGLGEINMFEGLSSDYTPEFYSKLNEIELNPQLYLYDIHESLKTFPSIRFGLEMAMLDYKNQKNRILFPSEFTQEKEGIPINGLIWMGTKEFMLQQIKSKLDVGFRCLKMKIGAINFDEELAILKSIRNEFKESDLELRVDANGGFNMSDALHKLQQLSNLQIHSIEQPIKQGQLKNMSSLCRNTPLPIALDEELIGINDIQKKAELLSQIKPQYIILKPALTGGFKASQEWIDLAGKSNISWWITSALESNIGLSAIAQWAYQLNTNNYQGLGTGQLFTNNINSPLYISGEKLFYSLSRKWADI